MKKIYSSDPLFIICLFIWTFYFQYYISSHCNLHVQFYTFSLAYIIFTDFLFITKSTEDLKSICNEYKNIIDKFDLLLKAIEKLPLDIQNKINYELSKKEN